MATKNKGKIISWPSCRILIVYSNPDFELSKIIEFKNVYLF